MQKLFAAAALQKADTQKAQASNQHNSSCWAMLVVKIHSGGYTMHVSLLYYKGYLVLGQVSTVHHATQNHHGVILLFVKDKTFLPQVSRPVNVQQLPATMHCLRPARCDQQSLSNLPCCMAQGH